MTETEANRLETTPAPGDFELPRWLARLVLLTGTALASFSLAGLVLGLVGVFRAGPLLIAGAATTYTLYSLWGPVGSRLTRPRVALLLLSAVAVGAFHGAFATGSPVAVEPEAATWITAQRLAGNAHIDALAQEGPFLASPQIRSAAPGFGSDGAMQSPRAAASLYGVAALAGDDALRLSPAILASLTIVLSFAVGLVWLRPASAAVVTAGLVANALFVVSARSVTPEMPTLALALAGLWAVGRGRVEQRPGQGVVAGILLGTAAIMTVPNLLILAGVAALVIVDEIGGWNSGWVARRRRRRWGAALLVGAAIPATVGLIDAIAAGWLSDFVDRLLLPLLVIIALLVGARLGWERRLTLLPLFGRMPWWLPVGALLMGGVYLVGFRAPDAPSGVLGLSAGEIAAALAPGGTLDSAAPWWLIWYAGALTVVVGLTAWVLLLWGDMRYQVREWRPIAVAGIVVLTVLIWDPQLAPTQHGAAMAFLPFVIPALLLGVGWVMDRLWDDPEATVGRAASVIVAILAVGFPLLEAVPLWDYEPQRGAAEDIATLCEEIDRRSAVVVVDDDAGFGPVVSASVRAGCDVPTGFVSAGTLESQLVPLVEPWRDEGRVVVVLGAEPAPLPTDDGTVLERVGTLDFEVLAETVTAPPTQYRFVAAELYLARFR